MDRRLPLLALIALLVAACDGSAEGTETVAAPLTPPAGRLAVSVDDDLAVVEADGSGREVVVTAPGPQFDSDWSPDGSRLVYRDSRTGVNVNDEIYVSSADGSGARNLTASPANDWSPAWSPDGEQIAFASDREGELRIFVMGADGSGVRRVTDIWGEYPAWSPDGTQIAFASHVGGTSLHGDPNYDVFVVNADGSGLRQLTESPAYDMYPTWSPDGTQIVVPFDPGHPGGLRAAGVRPGTDGRLRRVRHPRRGRPCPQPLARPRAAAEVPGLVARRALACGRRGGLGRLRPLGRIGANRAPGRADRQLPGLGAE